MTASTRSRPPTIPAGAYEVKVAHNLGWDENYGAGGAPGGANIPFTAPGGKPVTFSYVLATHVLTIEVTDPPLPGTGSAQAHWVDATTIAWPAAVLGGADPADLHLRAARLAHGGARGRRTARSARTATASR